MRSRVSGRGGIGRLRIRCSGFARLPSPAHFSRALGHLLEHVGGDAFSAPCLAVAPVCAACGLGRAAAAAEVSDGGTQELLKLFRVLLGLAAAYFVFAVFFVEFAGLLTAIDTLKAGNTAFTADTLLPAAGNITGSKSLAFSYIVLALRFGAKSLPTLFAAATAYFAIGLLDTMEDGAFTQESAAYAPKLAAWCVKVLKLSVLLALAVNLLQAVCAPLILSTSISIPLPVLELCFVLAALLGARLIASNVALAADNDLFI